MESFRIIGEITNVEVIALGPSIRELTRLRKEFGEGRWRKLKGIALVRLVNGHEYLAEVHWYEAHGIGKRKMKLKHLIERG